MGFFAWFWDFSFLMIKMKSKTGREKDCWTDKRESQKAEVPRQKLVHILTLVLSIFIFIYLLRGVALRLAGYKFFTENASKEIG